MQVRKASYIQAVMVQVLCSGLRVASESSTTPVGTSCPMTYVFADDLMLVAEKDEDVERNLKCLMN